MVSILNSFYPGYSWDDSVERTAERFLSFLMEYVPEEEYNFKPTVFDADVNQMIGIYELPFSSICKHHLLPFMGYAHAAYLPNELMIGASKIPRLIDYWSRRPQTQELLTQAIAVDLKRLLKAQGVAVLMIAEHTCMACRGVRKVGSRMITSEMRGSFLTSGDARAEFMKAVEYAQNHR